MKRSILLIALLLFPVAVFGQGARTADKIVDTVFSQLDPTGNLPNGSVRHIINGTPGTSPCTGGGSGAMAEKVAGVWHCPRLTQGAGTGDVGGVASSSAGEMVLYADATGKNLGNSNSLSGVVLLSAGVVSVLASSGSGDVVRATGPTISSGVLVTPTIASFVNAGHTHTSTSTGGQLNASNVFSAGTIPTARVVNGTITNSRCLRVSNIGLIEVAADDCGTGSGGTPGGVSGNLTFNESGSFGGFTSSSVNTTTGVLTFTQKANSNDLLNLKRFTDTSPTGTLIRLRNAANNADLFYVGADAGVYASSTILSKNVAAPSAPASGNTILWTDATDKNLKAQDSSGQVTVTLRATACSGTDKVSSISSAGVVTCTADQGSTGTGVISLNGLNADTQTFATVNDTNITIGVSSSATVHTFTAGFTGTLAKARQNANTAYIDAANTWSTGAQSFAAATSLLIPAAAGAAPTANGSIAYDTTSNTAEYGENGTNRIIANTAGSQTFTNKTLDNSTTANLKDTLLTLQDNTDSTKTANFELSGITTGSNRVVTIANAASVTVQPTTLTTNQFVTFIDSSGVVQKAQPSFANLSGTMGETQGGTGQTSFAQGDILYASAANTLAKLAKDTNATRYLSNTGSSNNPAWAQVDLTNGVTGILPSANGGVANAFFTVSGPTTSAKTFTFPNASATILTDNALVTAAQGGTANGFFAVTGPASTTKTFTFPNASATVLTTSALVTAAQGGTGLGAPGDDQLLVGNGTGYDFKTLPSCSNGTTDKLLYNSSTNTFTCGTDGGGGGGGGNVTTINGLTDAVQTFSKTDDTNVTLTITSATGNHNFALGWTGTLSDARVADNITLTNITQITNRALVDTTGDLLASRIDDSGVASTQALFSGGAGAAGFRAITDADVPDTITISLAAVATVANSGDSATAFFSSGTIEKTFQNAATVYNDAGNTYSTGAQDFASATSLRVPTSAGAGPITSGFIAYDSTSNTLEYGESGANRTIVNTARTVSTTGPLAGGGDLSANRTITCTTCTTSAAALTANQLVIGGGLQATSTLGSLGTTTTVLHGNAAGAPTFGAIVNADITNATIDLTTKVTGIMAGNNGGTNNGFMQFSGPATSTKTFTLPNASATILTDNAAVTLAQGGTGQTTAANAINALVPTQTSNSGKFLTTNGSVVSWGAVTATAGGSITNLQYNNAGALAGLATVTTDGTIVTFAAGDLLIGNLSTLPTPALGKLGIDTDDGKLYFGINGTTWGEVLISGLSTVNLASANVSGTLPPANGGTGVTALSFTVATLPAGVTGRQAYVTDGASSSDCTSGGGSTKVLCIYNGTAYTQISGGGGGSGTINSGVTNIIPKYTASTTIDDSLLSDNGTTLSYSGTGGITTTATGAGYLQLSQGTAPSNGTTAIQLVAPTSVTSYQIIYPGAAATGIPHFANSANVITSTISGIAVADLTATGTPSSSTFLRGDNVWATPAGSGTVTATGGSLTSNSVVLGAGTTDTKVVAGIITDGTSALTLGVAGASVGAINFKNATSGTITVSPVTGALGSVTLSLPARTATIATTTGTLTSGRCVEIDSSGNLIQSAAACGSGGGGTITSGATNFIPKYTASTTIDDSLLSDDATTLTYSGTGGLSLTATGAGSLQLTQGTAPSAGTTAITIYAPTSVTSYKIALAGAAATGIPHYANSSNTITETISAIDLASSDVTGILPIAKFTTGTPNGSKFVRDDGVLAVPAGSGTVTATGGSLTSNSVVLGAGSTDTKVVAGIITDGTSKLTLGVAGTSVGSIDFKNATSGTITLSPVTGALGTVTLSLPARTATIATTTGTLTNGRCVEIDASGNLIQSAAACGSALTVGTSTITSGTATRLLYETSGNLVGEVSGATSDGTTLTVTSPKLITALLDTNGNEIFKVTATGSATNEITIANAANSGSPTISTTGSSDSNIDLTIAPKGTGKLLITPATAGTGILSLADTNQSHYLNITPGSDITADRTLTLTTGDSDRTINLGGNLTTAAAFITSGANSLTLTTTSSTNVTLPTSGTLATLAGTEALTGKTVNGLTVTTTTGTFTLTNGKTLSVSNSLTLAGSDSTTMTFPSSSATVSTLGLDQTVTGVQTLSPTARTSGAAAYFTLNIPADTAQTAATESPGFKTVTATRTWATTGTIALQRENFFAGPTYASASASQTFTDAFTLYATPPVAGSNAIFTRGHTLGIVDSTSASSAITGGLVVATTLGTAATSVGIGGGNVNAGGNGTFGGTLAVTGHITVEGITSTGATGTGKLVFDTAPQLSQIELGAASDTTIARVGAGQISVEGVNVMTTSSTDTKTNLTLDVEGTGNVFTSMHVLDFPAAGCNNTTASSFWDLPTSTPAVAACVSGTNTQKAYLDFADTTGGFSAQTGFRLPADFTGTIDAKITWLTTATSGNAKWSLSTICTATDATETDDPAFNTASTVTTAAAGVASRLQTSTITSLTITGCAVGEWMHVKIFRDGNDGSDTLSATARLVGVQLVLRRAQ